MKFWAHAAGAALLIAGQGTAAATDLALKDPPPMYDITPVTLWAGPYVGVHIGGARGKTSIKDTFDYYGDPVVKSKVDSDGLVGGVHAGYNIQRGTLVYGLEFDLGKFDMSGSKFSNLQKTEFNVGGGAKQWGLNSTYSASNGLYGDLALRVGMTPARNSLFYLKGGPAVLNMDYNAHYVGKTGGNANGTKSFDFAHSDTLWGWTLGAGVEYALSSRLSLKAEYQHFDFGDTSFHDHQGSKPQPVLDTKVDVSPTVDAVTVGLNYRLGMSDGGN